MENLGKIGVECLALPYNNRDFYIAYQTLTNSVVVEEKKVKSIFMTLLDVNCAQKVEGKPFGFVLVSNSRGVKGN